MGARQGQVSAAEGEGSVATEPWVNYRYEYVSGGFPLLKQVGFQIQIFVANRGGTEGIAQGYLSLSDSGGVSDLTVFDSGEMGVAPGQACVLYDADGGEARILGGGTIARTADAQRAAAA